MDHGLRNSVRAWLAEQHLTDAHSHLPPEKVWKEAPANFLSLMDYSSGDIVSAGMDRDLWVAGAAADDRMRFEYGYDPQPDPRSDEELWRDIGPYWPYIKNIGSGYLVQKALRLLCDTDDINADTIPHIRKCLESWRDNSSYEDMIREKAKIDLVIGVTFDMDENPNTPLTKKHLYTDIYTGIQNRRQLYRLEQLSGKEIYSLHTYVDALDTFIDRQIEKGAIGFKWHFYPYMRPMTFDLADSFAAEKALDKLLLLPPRGATGSAVNVGFDEMEPLHNYLQHHLLRRAAAQRLPIQIHTGTFGGTLGGHLDYSNPSHLVDTFKRYPQINFNILHSSFPYQREAGELARIFPNVFVNATWVDTLSPMAFRADLKEWLTYIPLNKIIAFGSDQFSPTLTWASAENTRDLMSYVLADLIEEGYFTEKDARFAADRVLRSNALSFYGANRLS